MPPLGAAADADAEGLAGARADGRPCELDQPGRFEATLHGSLELEIQWQGPALHCEGMLRPDGQGIRLFFVPGDEDEPRISVVLGIDASLERIGDGEHATNVTLIDEQSGRFFSSADQDRCWSRIHEARRLERASPREWRIDGEVFCVGSLPSLTDMASVTPAELRFSGRVTEPDPES